MATILVVDDELKITRLLRDYLERAGFDVITAGDGPTAVSVTRARRPDLVVLDLGLPGMDGLDVTRAIRRHTGTPIVMLTARSEETDTVAGLELGADDYMTKPFSPAELVARVRAVLRRTETGMGPGEVIRVGRIVVDVDRRTVRVDGAETDALTPSEFDILLTLARQPGRVFTRAQLGEEMHGVRFESRAVDAHVKNLRRKIEPDHRAPVFVLTVHGVGYRFADA